MMAQARVFLAPATEHGLGVGSSGGVEPAQTSYERLVDGMVPRLVAFETLSARVAWGASACVANAARSRAEHALSSHLIVGDRVSMVVLGESSLRASCQRARQASHNGPWLIACRCARIRGHSTSRDASISNQDCCARPSES